MGSSAEPETSASPLSPVTFVFTGRGGEYFRIWVVNLLLTVLTLGIYSAWAKVRRAKYFWQNTRLEEHVFDYHGVPLAILRGPRRLVLTAYLGIPPSTLAGLTMTRRCAPVGPWLFMRAHSCWATAHLRFGFRARSSEAYRVVCRCLLWLFPGVLFALELDAGY
jgi:uncharacterized membrane protein YjgN (DUF898 family)